MSKKNLLADGIRDGRYVRAWKEGRGEIMVQVWNGETPDGEPAGDWAMPAFLGVDLCVEQAMLQTGGL